MLPAHRRSNVICLLLYIVHIDLLLVKLISIAYLKIAIYLQSPVIIAAAAPSVNIIASDDEVEDVTKQTEEDVSVNSEEDTGELTASSEQDIEKNTWAIDQLYKPLDLDRKESRMVLVKAGSEIEPLQCQLQQAFLSVEPMPLYETISYC